MPATKAAKDVTNKTKEELYSDILVFLERQRKLEEELRALEKERAEIKNGLLQAIDKAKIKKLKKKFLN